MTSHAPAGKAIPATAIEEVRLLRVVYEAARSVLRFHGVDDARTVLSLGVLDAAIERVKRYDLEPASGDALTGA